MSHRPPLTRGTVQAIAFVTVLFFLCRHFNVVLRRLSQFTLTGPPALRIVKLNYGTIKVLVNLLSCLAHNEVFPPSEQLRFRVCFHGSDVQSDWRGFV